MPTGLDFEAQGHNRSVASDGDSRPKSCRSALSPRASQRDPCPPRLGGVANEVRSIPFVPSPPRRVRRGPASMTIASNYAMAQRRRAMAKIPTAARAPSPLAMAAVALRWLIAHTAGVISSARSEKIPREPWSPGNGE